MWENVDERVSVLASFNQGPRNTIVVLPLVMRWAGRRYSMDKFGLYHPERRGTRLIHIFSFMASESTYKVELDPDTLEWRLVGIRHGA